jgi:hypothetical protein
VGIRGKFASSSFGAVGSMCSSSSHEWDSQTLGATYLVSFDAPASPLYGSEWCQKGFSLHQQTIISLTIYLQIPVK